MGHGVEPENDRVRRNHSARTRESCENRTPPVDAHKSEHRPRTHFRPAVEFIFEHGGPLLHLFRDAQHLWPLGILLFRLHLSSVQRGVRDACTRDASISVPLKESASPFRRYSRKIKFKRTPLTSITSPSLRRKGPWMGEPFTEGTLSPGPI